MEDIDKIIYINLDRRKDRRQEIEQEFIPVFSRKKTVHGFITINKLEYCLNNITLKLVCQSGILLIWDIHFFNRTITFQKFLQGLSTGNSLMQYLINCVTDWHFNFVALCQFLNRNRVTYPFCDRTA